MNDIQDVVDQVGHRVFEELKDEYHKWVKQNRLYNICEALEKSGYVVVKRENPEEQITVEEMQTMIAGLPTFPDLD